jgi:type IX secretion system PorP/SprF family membrane protein
MTRKELKNKNRYRAGMMAILIACSLSFAASCQDIHFSQFFNAPLLRNPSLAGIFTGDTRIQGVYRDQWNSVTNAYRTGSLDAEFKNPIGRSNDFITFGGQVMYDRAGSIGWTSTYVMPAINYHKSLSDQRNSYLSLGFMGGLVQNRIDLSKITTNSTYDGFGVNEPNIQPQHTYLDGSVGMSYNASLNDNPENNFFVGAAYHHFNRPQNSFYRNPSIELQPKWVYSGGIRFAVTEYAYMTMMADYSQQGSYSEVVGGGMYGFKLGEDPDHPDYVINGGAFLRWNDALIPVIKLDYDPFSVTLSYDANISKLKTSSYGRGGFEIAISYTGFSKRRSSVDAMFCPRF